MYPCRAPMAREAWTYRDRGSYGTNSYGKPALTLQTLEGLVGEETMVDILRTFARRYTWGGSEPSTPPASAVART